MFQQLLKSVSLRLSVEQGKIEVNFVCPAFLYACIGVFSDSSFFVGCLFFNGGSMQLYRLGAFLPAVHNSLFLVVG